MRELIEADRFSEVLRFFVARILGVPVKDDDHAFALLEQQQRAPENLKPAPSHHAVEHLLTRDVLVPAEANTPSTANSIRGQSKIGRNEPCPCGSGKKFKRCCWLSSS